MTLQLDPTLETLFLVLQQNGMKERKKEAIKQLDEFGINGAAFYAANFSLIERYYRAFNNRITHTGVNELFKDVCDELAILLIVIVILHKEWLDDFDSISEEEVHTAVNEVVAEYLESEEGIIGALGASGLSDQAKWQISALTQQPKQQLGLFIEAINKNIGAFEYAYTELEDEITPLLAQFDDQLKKGELGSFLHQTLALNPEFELVPTLAEPLIIMGLGNYCFAGLLLNKLLPGQNESLSDIEATLVTKSLSDPSKLEILRALKNEDLYNLEIAQKLGLTPATTSHHMNMLLSAGLVGVTKKGNRVYYCLCTDGIKRYRNWLDNNLLNTE